MSEKRRGNLDHVVSEALEESNVPTGYNLETEQDGIAVNSEAGSLFTEYGTVGFVKYHEVGTARSNPVSLGSTTYVVGFLEGEDHNFCPIIWENVREETREQIIERVDDHGDIVFNPPAYFKDLRSEWDNSGVLGSASATFPTMNEAEEYERPSITEIEKEIEEEEARTVSDMHLFNKSRSKYYAYLEHEVIPYDPNKQKTKKLTVLGRVTPRRVIEDVEPENKEGVERALENIYCTEESLEDIRFADELEI